MASVSSSPSTARLDSHRGFQLRRGQANSHFQPTDTPAVRFLTSVQPGGFSAFNVAWHGGRDSNPQLRGPKPRVLPLNYRRMNPSGACAVCSTCTRAFDTGCLSSPLCTPLGVAKGCAATTRRPKRLWQLFNWVAHRQRLSRSTNPTDTRSRGRDTNPHQEFGGLLCCQLHHPSRCRFAFR